MRRSAVASILRSTQAYCIQVCEKHTLEFGIAYTCDGFPELPEVQQFREVVADNESSLEDAFEEAESAFGQSNKQFHVWAPADGTYNEAAAEFLEKRGLSKRTFTAMALTRWVDIVADDSVRVLPARPMRAALRKTFDTEDRSRLCELRLDDPQYDMFVALVNGEPAGRCALYQVGDIARVMDLHVHSTGDETGVERSLLAHVLGMARRLEMRNICTLIDSHDAVSHQRFSQVGFVPDGELVESHRRKSKATGAGS